jgi:hypothetical protein
MASRKPAGTVAALAGTLWVSASFAAPFDTAATGTELKPVPRDSIAIARDGQVVDLGLASVVPLGTRSPLLWRAPDASGVQFNAARGRNLDFFGNLFAGSAGLRSSYLFGDTTAFTAALGLPGGVSFRLNQSRLQFSAMDDSQPSALTRDLAVRFTDGRTTQVTSVYLNWNFADWGGLGVSASQGNGAGALLGAPAVSLGAASVLSTSALGVSARVGFGEGWVTSVSYSEGVTQLDLSSTGLSPNADPLHSEGYGISLAKQGLFGGDTLGIAVSRPLQIYSGNSNLAALNSLSSSQAHESDVELGYVTTFLDGTLALQANAAYQMNAAGAKGQNAVTGVARAKINF